MNGQNSSNTVLAIALSVLVLIAWQFFYISPKMEAERKAAEVEAQRAQVESSQNSDDTLQNAENSEGKLPNVGVDGEALNVEIETSSDSSLSRDAALADSNRVSFENDHVIGSINLKSARIDDLRLKKYHETIDKSSPIITLLSPSQTTNGYFAEFGYVGNAESGEVPGPKTEWQNVGGGTLSQNSPVVLEWTNANNVTFRRTIELDETYLFTFNDEISNGSNNALTISPYGRIIRFGTPTTEGIFVLHEGLIGVMGEQGLQEIDYGDLQDDKEYNYEKADGGWLGITDKYWATAIVPEGTYKPRFAYFGDRRDQYQSDFLADSITINAGSSDSVSQSLFAGAKKTEIIDAYEANNGIESFDLLIDWGWFYFITKPLFFLMNFFFKYIGNFGVAILLSTVVIKALLFYFANLSYASMAKMKKLQPQMQEIKEKAGDDKRKVQQEMMELYKKEKINPAAGCWPMLIQIPVFFALYKVIYVTIEMRHAPFFGWIQDLSAPDPTSMFNLFGLLPYDVPGFLLVGVWPLLMGITMFLQMQMNPTPPDPTQQMIFKWMPIVFTFMLATFPAGLVIYWAWNNFLSILQQGTIMRRHDVKIELWDNLKGMLAGKKGDASS